MQSQRQCARTRFHTYVSCKLSLDTAAPASLTLDHMRMHLVVFILGIAILICVCSTSLTHILAFILAIDEEVVLPEAHIK